MIVKLLNYTEPLPAPALSREILLVFGSDWLEFKTPPSFKAYREAVANGLNRIIVSG